MVQKLDLVVKSGIGVVQPTTPTKVIDHRGIMFYTTEGFLNRDKIVPRFNLPPGTYTVVSGGGVTLLNSPVPTPHISLPPPERNYPDPTKFDVLFQNNPNKCSIEWDKRRIVFDTSFRGRPLPILEFILAHEFGHSKYKTEAFADLWAAKYLLDMGYNPSQIGLVPMNTLSNYQDHRKVLMVEKITGKRL